MRAIGGKPDPEFSNPPERSDCRCLQTGTGKLPGLLREQTGPIPCSRVAGCRVALRVLAPSGATNVLPGPWSHWSNERIECVRAKVRVEKLVYGGAGLARHGEETLLVPFVLPGDRVEVELGKRTGGVRQASVVGWTESAGDRAEAPCAVFGTCGGCHYQHVPYEQECRYKTGILRETLRRIGGLDWTDEIEVASAQPWAYRNRTQLHLGISDGDRRPGFLGAASHTHVPVSECPINGPKLNELHLVLADMVTDRRFPKSLRTVEIFTNGHQTQLNLPRRPGPLPRKFWAWCADRFGVGGPGVPLDYACGGDVFRVSGRSFFQVNRFLAGKVAELALADVPGGLAVDLYCGVGLLTLPLARTCESVIGVDVAESAVRDLQSNAARAGLGIRAVHAGVGDFLRGFQDRPDVIVADPPRAGLGPGVVEQIVRLAPPDLRLVSCDPSTLARDMQLLRAGGYAVQRIHLVDMFPQTYHIETVAFLGRV